MPPRLWLITDPAHGDPRAVEVVRRVGAALAPGVFGVILRDGRRGAALLDVARALRAATRDHGAFLLVHSDPELARAASADGVHLGGAALEGGARALDAARAALPAGWISVAAHADEDVEVALRHGADAALVSPIFDAPGKGPARGVGALARARARAPELALYALGGVDETNAAACLCAGASGVAVIRALLTAGPVEEVARRLSGDRRGQHPEPMRDG
jgi:thiamine-phosphate pyrophosphorylase